MTSKKRTSPFDRFTIKFARLHGMPIRSIANTFDLNRQTIRDIIGDLEPASDDVRPEDTARLRQILIRDLGLPDDDYFICQRFELAAIDSLEAKVMSKVKKNV